MQSASSHDAASCYTGVMRFPGSGDRKWWALTGLVAAIAAIAVVLATGGSERPSPVGEELPEPIAPAEPLPEEQGQRGETARPEASDEDPADEPPPLDEATLSPAQRQAARTVRAYIEGLNARDGEAVCDLLAPGAIEAVELPRRRGSCPASLRASIGYRDPRGFPVWDSVSVRGLLTVALDDGRASVTVTTVTRFADRDQPSIEDDVVHLLGQDGRWLIGKPSSTLYRAVGIADVPPRVLGPPD